MRTLGIALPVAGDCPHLAGCFDSLLGITTDTTVIIQDGGTNAESSKMIASYLGRFPPNIVGLHRRAKDLGQSDAINRVWRDLESTHRLLTWVNGDDKVDAEGMDAAVSWALRHGNEGVVYGDYGVIGPDDRLIKTVRSPDRVGKMSLLLCRNRVPGVGMLIRSDLVRQLGPLDVDLQFTMDLEYWLRASATTRLTRADWTTAYWRDHRGSKTVARSDEAAAEAQAVRLRYSKLANLYPITAPVMRLWYIGARTVRSYVRSR